MFTTEDTEDTEFLNKKDYPDEHFVGYCVHRNLGPGLLESSST